MCQLAPDQAGPSDDSYQRQIALCGELSQGCRVLFTLRPLMKSLGRKGHNRLGNRSLLVCSKVREHRYREYFGRSAFSYGKISQAVVQWSISFLQMQGNWVVNSRSDPRLFQVAYHAVAVVGADHIEVI